MFPGTESPHVDFTKLIESITYVLRSNQMGYMQIEESFINKVIEVYQTVLLRHGLMTVGQTSSERPWLLRRWPWHSTSLIRKNMTLDLHTLISFSEATPA